jgi:hypothetical protein
MGRSSLVHLVLYGARYQKGKSSEVEGDVVFVVVVVKERKSCKRSTETESKSVLKNEMYKGIQTMYSLPGYWKEAETKDIGSSEFCNRVTSIKVNIYIY